MYWNIVATRGHYEVYAGDGSFLFSTDTRAEAMEEIAQWEEEHIG